MQINESELKRIVSDAYEAGCRGFLCMRDHYCNSVLKDMAKREIIFPGGSCVVSSSCVSNSQAGDYYYSVTAPMCDINFGRQEIL